MEGTDKRREDIYSVSVRAGKRTYFFDVKETRQEDYYLTITESKKVFDKDGNSRFEKHKIFLYKEDFDKFMEGYVDVVEFIKKAQPEYFEKIEQERKEAALAENDVSGEQEADEGTD